MGVGWVGDLTQLGELAQGFGQAAGISPLVSMGIIWRLKCIDRGMGNMMTNQPQSVPAGSVSTVWQLRTYDVWGNARDGWQVNDSYDAGEVMLSIPQTRHNVGTTGEFASAYPSDRQIKLVFGVRCRIETEGDDLHIDVTRQKDGYPIGEMQCVSHESLSPVRRWKV